MSDRLIVGTRKGMFVLNRSASGYNVSKTAFLGDPVSLTHYDAAHGTLFAALDHGHFGVKLHRSTDGGTTFTEVGKPAFPEKPEGLEDKDGMGRHIPWDVKLIWAFAGTRDSLWCGTIPGGLFYSTDGGESWSLNRALWDHPGRKAWFGGGADYPGIHSVLVDPRDDKRLLVGISCGGVWLTEDAGHSWTCRADGMRAAYVPPEREREPGIQDPHCIVQCPSSPDVLWAQHHNGIFRSTDGAASWQEIENVSPSAFGFATVVHPQDADTAWFVPAIDDGKRIPVDGKLVVTRTRDGGHSFATLREGLPQQHAYDLTFRHALDIDATGNQLAFGSTTGSLWLSENQGDAWTQLSAHLPPVYSVRFA